MTFINGEGEQEKDDLTGNRQDFRATISNKQLLQQIRAMLNTTRRAAVVLPDKVLFEAGLAGFRTVAAIPDCFGLVRFGSCPTCRPSSRWTE